MQVKADEAIKRKVPLAHACVGAVDFAIERQHQGNRMFCHRVGRIFRYAHHWQPQLRGRGEVDVIEPSGAQGDQAHAHTREPRECFAIEFIVDEGAYHVGSCGERCGFRGEARI